MKEDPYDKAHPSEELVAITLHELMNTDYPEDIFIEGGLLSRGDRMLLGADSKAGKSTLLVQMLRCATQAKDFIGFKIPKPLKILFMQAELKESRLKERMMATALLMPVPARNNFLINSTGGMVMLNRPEDLERVRRLLDKTRPDILCIDPMANFHDRDENSSTEMMNFFRLLDRLKNEFNMAIVMSTHFRKGKKTSKNGSVLEMIRGSSALRGWGDTTIAIEGRQGDKAQHLEFELRNSDSLHQRTLYFDKHNKEFKWEDPLVTCAKWAKEFVTDEGIQTNKFVLALLKECGDCLSKNRSKAYKIKDQLVQDGILYEEQDGKSVYLFVSKSEVQEPKLSLEEIKLK